MILMDFLVLPDDRFLGFHFQGHAGWADEGMDIVCAAVSSAAYMAANTITEVVEAQPEALEAEEGEMRLLLAERDAARCQVILAGLEFHMRQLERQYPAHIKVGYQAAGTKL